MTEVRLLTLALARDQDLVGARQRARQVAALAGLEALDQSRVATAVSEVARNALMYAGGGTLHVDIDNQAEAASLVIRVVDRGPGIAELDAILAGRYRSSTGMGLGLAGTRRLMDDFDIRTGPQGTTVTLVKRLPRSIGPVGEMRRHAIVAELARRAPRDVYAELNVQNQELAQSLAQLRERHDELARLNRELEDTNRGVVALYAELDEKAETLRRADQAKSRFLSSASHELRTPLNAIGSLAQLLLDRVDGPLAPEQERQVRLIRNAAGSLGELVDDLLDLAKIEAGKTDVHVAAFEVAELWSALRGMMKPLQANAQVALVFDAPPAATLHTDEAKIAQILRNLVSNALKFTERGEVRVSARLQADDQIVFEVADTGIGIAPQHLDRVFEEFSQIEGPLQRRHKGTGLGLPLCRRLAQLLGGQVDVQSDPGVGSRFSVRLPVRHDGESAGDALQPDDAPAAKASPSAAGAPSAEAASHAAIRTVLLVDDDEALRYALARQLRPRFTVHEAADGAQGLAAWSRLAPDAVVLDLQMPELTGWELLDQVRAPGRRVVVLTAQQLDAAQRERIAACGALLLEKDERAAVRLVDLLAPAERP